MMRKTRQLIKRISIFFLLTILTQLGGIIYLVSIWLSSKIRLALKFKTTVVFCLLYLVCTYLLIPLTAPLGGREKLKQTSNLKPVTYISVLLNRNYVTKELNSYLVQLAANPRLVNNSIQVRYLDGCFPFFNGFPLLPHLSHNDGKKIDLSLIYEDTEGDMSNKSKSISGYGVFENPRANEFNQTDYCKKAGYFQYDYPKYLTLGQINPELQFSEKGTRMLLESILDTPGIEKLFIEPHLKDRLAIEDSRIRFQGCRAVRHDDHIHIQLR